jgi:hypothetical protein
LQSYSLSNLHRRSFIDQQYSMEKMHPQKKKRGQHPNKMKKEILHETKHLKKRSKKGTPWTDTSAGIQE